VLLREEANEVGPELLALLRPCPDEWLKIWPVDKRVGNVRNREPELTLFERHTCERRLRLS
jgi:putative SOS response-associated peptidase YedK